tara:strand:- start:243 stop:638 length:396 start_codon:yes stop_codon:yes gene_type:complete
LQIIEESEELSSMASGHDDELTRLREERLAALQKQAEEQARAQLESEERSQLESQEKAHLSQAMKTILKPEARERLARLELGRPELADEVRKQLAGLHENGQIAVPVSDESLKRILASLDSGKRESTIRRI